MPATPRAPRPAQLPILCVAPLLLVVLLLLHLLPRAALAQQDAACDAQYVCEYTAAGLSWDLSSLCNTGGTYWWQDPVKNEGYAFQVCGNVQPTAVLPADGAHIGFCNPESTTPRPQYSRGAVLQFDFMGDPPPLPNCTAINNLGFPAPCTRSCNVVGVGAPAFGLFDNQNPSTGVNLTYIAVDALAYATCAVSESGRVERSSTISVLCDSAALVPSVEFVREDEPCKYSIVMRSALGCGRVRDCWQRNCGPDGAGGYCGGAGNYGRCDLLHKCSARGQCCAADCRGRTCGDDGCGGSCGTCGAGSQCTKFQTCAVVNASPSSQPASLASASITTSTSGDYMAAYIGGVVTVPIALLVASFAYKLAAASRSL